MSKTLAELKTWLYAGVTPLLMVIIGYLLNDKLETIDKRLSALEGLQNQVAVNTTNISYLSRDVNDTKRLLQEHLAAIPAEEITIKKKRQ